MTVLVTGSSGHLGEALMRTLAARDIRAVGLDIVPSPFTTLVGDIADRAVVQAAIVGVTAVLHTATLHKPHVATHTRQAFVDTNVTGTLNLLEEATAAGVRAFVYTSTTSAFGAALTPPPDAPAAWIDEDVVPVPKNIYGVTKVAAENLCEIMQRRSGTPCIVLRTSRFFPEPDDVVDKRDAFDDTNLKINELLYRRADIADIVDAHLLAIDRASAIGFARYIISATTPLTREDLPQLQIDPHTVVARHVPAFEAIYAARGWRMMDVIDRVYDNTRARRELGWTPVHDFAHAIACIRDGCSWRSALADSIGMKGYHAGAFPDGVYPTT